MFQSSKAISILFAASFLLAVCLFAPIKSSAQVKWINVDDAYQPLPENFHVYKTTDSLDGKPFIAYYAIAKLQDRHLIFTTDTARDRRITPSQFYTREDQHLLLVNCTY